MITFQSGVELFQYALIAEEEMTVMMSQCQWQLGEEGPDKQEELTHSQSVRKKHKSLSFLRTNSSKTAQAHEVLWVCVLMKIFWERGCYPLQGETVKKGRRVTMSFFQRIGSIVENVKVGVISLCDDNSKQI